MRGMVSLLTLLAATLLLSPHSSERGAARTPHYASEKDETQAGCEYPEIALMTEGPDTAVIRIIGDVMLHSAQIGSDWSTFLSGIEEDLRGADIGIANLEFSLGGPPYTGYPAFSSPDAYASYIAGTGINVFLTANNHILDRGSKGLGRTLAIYSEMEEEKALAYTGCGISEEDFALRNPLYVRARGMKLAIVNVTYGTNAGMPENFPRPAQLEEGPAMVARAKQEGADIVIAVPHWGTEYVTRHNSRQEKAATELARAGADIIVGAHPHVVQDKGSIKAGGDDGRVREVPVFYSIGNAVSNMSARNTQASIMVSISVVRHQDGRVEMLEPAWEWLWCTRPGKLCNSYKTIKADEWASRRDEWLCPSDFDNMSATIRRLKTETGLE